MAGTQRLMPRSSLLFIHNAWTYASGNAEKLRKRAEELEKITQPSVEIYKSVSSLDESEIKKMMDEETWITADEAMSYGFATQVVEDNPQQSMKDDMISRLVHQNKKLEKQLNEKANEPTQKKGWFF